MKAYLYTHFNGFIPCVVLGSDPVYPDRFQIQLTANRPGYRKGETLSDIRACNIIHRPLHTSRESGRLWGVAYDDATLTKALNA